MIARYLGLTRSGEQALADAFVLVGLRHAAEPDMRNAARLHFNWCSGHVEALRPAIERYGAARSVEGERLRRALFRGRRTGGFGLLRDVHDLITLASSVHGCWTGLRQAARERRDTALATICDTCDAETGRQIAWLETKLRQAAPQALTVPSETGRELIASIPASGETGALADLIPGAALRRILPLAPVGGALVLALAVVLVSRPGRKSVPEPARAI
jgi:hypothetical protein